METHWLIGVCRCCSVTMLHGLVCSLLGSSLSSCFGCLICLANVLLLTLCVLSVHQSADENLHVKRSLHGPLPWVVEVGRLIFLTATWLLDDLEQLVLFLLLWFPFLCIWFNDIYLICKALWTLISGKLPNSGIFFMVLPLVSLTNSFKIPNTEVSRDASSVFHFF